MYEIGSYWVYQDTSTLQLDSIIVTSWSNRVRFLGGTNVCGEPEQAEEIMLTYQSSLKGIYTGCLITHLITLNKQTMSACHVSVVDSIDIAGTPYYDVIEISNLNSGGSFKGYYKESIGFIRKIEYNYPIDTTTYDLVRYQVNLFSNPF